MKPCLENSVGDLIWKGGYFGDGLLWQSLGKNLGDGTSWGWEVFKKCFFFCLGVVWERYLTLHHLNRRVCVLTNHCCLCMSLEELANHMLIHCGKTRGLWQFLFFLFGCFF